jgi:hypothetical protein
MLLACFHFSVGFIGGSVISRPCRFFLVLNALLPKSTLTLSRMKLGREEKVYPKDHDI